MDDGMSLIMENVSTGLTFLGTFDSLPKEANYGDICTLPDGSIHVYVGGDVVWDVLSECDSLEDNSSTSTRKMVARTTCEHCNANLDLFDINLNSSGVVRCSYCGGYTRIYE